MASTLIKRVCDPNQMTEQQRSDVMAEKAYDNEERLKLGLHATLAVMQEIRKGRLPAIAMMEWLTADEFIDATTIISAVELGTFSNYEVKQLCLLAEYGTYTCAQVETILGL